jgi:hypothetical protein
LLFIIHEADILLLSHIKREEKRLWNRRLIGAASGVELSPEFHNLFAPAPIYIFTYLFTYIFTYICVRKGTSVYKNVYKTKYLYTGCGTVMTEKMVVLFDQFNMPDSVFDIIFATKQQVVVAKMLIEEMKGKDGEIGKTEMSLFATALHDGIKIATKPGPGPKKETTISYNKRQFYDRILTPMKTMGLIDYDLYKKTYKLSEKFNKNMMKIGLLWLQELRKPPREFVMKK